jgi:hypothetical protein
MCRREPYILRRKQSSGSLLVLTSLRFLEAVPMNSNVLRILAVTDEIDMMSEHARDACKGYDYQIIENANASQDLMTGHELHGLAIDVVSESDLNESMRTRSSLGIKYDLVTLFSFRVRSLAKVLTGILSAVRSENVACTDGIRMGALPVAVMNRLELVSNPAHPTFERYRDLFSEKELYVASAVESFPEMAARAVGTWWLNAVCELQYQGVGLQVDRTGTFSICGTYAEPIDGSFYFAGGASVQNLLRKVWRVKGAADELNEAVIALNESLNKAAKASKKQQEPILQRCFTRYPELLSMGLYDTLLPEMSLNAPDAFGTGIRPDFIAMNSVIPGLQRAAAVIELKSPEMRLRTARKASEQFCKAIDQLGHRYRRYFDDPRTTAEQKEKLGQSLTSPKLLLIIGRNAWQKEWLDLREDHRKTEHSDMRIASYDDVYDLAQCRLHTLRNVRERINLNT